MSDKTGGPAFPVPDTYHPSGQIEYYSTGASLRDYFAAKALPAVIAGYLEANGRVIGTEHILRNCPILAYQIADEMIKARKA